MKFADPHKRPSQEVKDRVCELAEAQCTDQEIAGDVWGSYDNFLTVIMAQPSLRVYIDSSRARGRAQLKLAQYRRALSGSRDADRMLTWLGKQYLEQREPDSKRDTSADQGAESWVDILRLANQETPENVIDLKQDTAT